MNLDNNQKGKGNGQRKAYDHAVSTNLFGVADRIKELRKNPRNNGNKRSKRA